MGLKSFNWRKVIFFSLGVVLGLEWMNIFKPSLRSRMLYGLIRLFYKKPVTEDVAVQRGYLGRLQDLVPAPLKVDVNEVMADGVPCEWILPADEISTQVVFSFSMPCPSLYFSEWATLKLITFFPFTSFTMASLPRWPMICNLIMLMYLM